MEDQRKNKKRESNGNRWNYKRYGSMEGKKEWM